MITRLHIYLHPNTRGLPPKIWGGFMESMVSYIFYGNLKSITISVKERDYLMNTAPQKLAKGYVNVLHNENCNPGVNRASLQEDLRLFSEYAGSINASSMTTFAFNELASKLFINDTRSMSDNGTHVGSAVRTAMGNSSNVSTHVVVPKPKKPTEAEKQTARELTKVLKVSDKAATKMTDAPAVDLSW